jgi:hypothetical protein
MLPLYRNDNEEELAAVAFRYRQLSNSGCANDPTFYSREFRSYGRWMGWDGDGLLDKRREPWAWEKGQGTPSIRQYCCFLAGRNCK